MFRTLLMQIRKGFRNYIIKGASLVSGNDIKGVGDYDASTGKYNVPIVAGSTTYPLQISAPLYKVGTVADEADASTNTITRNIQYLDMGELSAGDWSKYSYSPYIGVLIRSVLVKPATRQSYISTHFGVSPTSSVLPNTQAFLWCGVANAHLFVLFSVAKAQEIGIYDSVSKGLDITAFRSWLGRGRPKVIYSLPAPTTESQAMPEIQGWQEGMTLMTETEVQGEIVIN